MKFILVLLVILFFGAFVSAETIQKVDYSTKLITEKGVTAISPHNSTVESSEKLVLKVIIENLSNEPISIESFSGWVKYVYNGSKMEYSDRITQENIYLVAKGNYSLNIPLIEFNKLKEDKKIGDWKIQLETTSLNFYGAGEKANPIDFKVLKEDKVANKPFDWNGLLTLFGLLEQPLNVVYLVLGIIIAIGVIIAYFKK